MSWGDAIDLLSKASVKPKLSQEALHSQFQRKLSSPSPLSPPTPVQEAEAKTYSASVPNIDYKTALAMIQEEGRKVPKKVPTTTYSEAAGRRKFKEPVTKRELKKPVVDIAGEVRSKIGSHLPKAHLLKQSKEQARKRYAKKYGTVSADKPSGWEQAKRLVGVGKVTPSEPTTKEGKLLAQKEAAMSKEHLKDIGPSSGVLGSGYGVGTGEWFDKKGKLKGGKVLGDLVATGAEFAVAGKLMGWLGKIGFKFLPKSTQDTIIKKITAAASKLKYHGKPGEPGVKAYEAMTGRASPKRVGTQATTQSKMGPIEAAKIEEQLRTALASPPKGKPKIKTRDILGSSKEIQKVKTGTYTKAQGDSAASSKLAHQTTGSQKIGEAASSQSKAALAPPSQVKPKGEAKPAEYTLESVKKEWGKRLERILKNKGDSGKVMGEGVTPTIINQSGALPKGQVKAIEKMVVDKLKRDPRWSNPGWRESREFDTLYRDEYFKQVLTQLENNKGAQRAFIDWFSKRDHQQGKAILESGRMTYKPPTDITSKSWVEANDLLKGIYDPEALIPPAWAGATHILKSIYEEPNLLNVEKGPTVNTNINNWSDACNLLSLV